MAEDYRMTAVDEKGRRIYTDSGEYIPLWKREGKSPGGQKKPSGGGAGSGLAGIAALVGGKYLETHIPRWISGASSTAAGGTGSFFGAGGATAAQQAAIDSLGADIGGIGSVGAEAGLTGGGGIGGGGAGGATASSGVAPWAAYAAPAVIALAAAHNIHKLAGGGKDADEEAGRWRDAAAQGYKYSPSSFDTLANPDARQLADQSGLAALLLGNSWNEKFTPEERSSVMQKVLDSGSFNESKGGYHYDKGALARAAQEIATAKGQGDWVMGRYNEQKKRDDRDTQLLLGHGPNKLPGERSPNMRDFARGPYRDYISADWMPESYKAAIAKLQGQV